MTALDLAAWPDPPPSPDFDRFPIGPAIGALTPSDETLTVCWADGRTARFNRFWLRENAVEPDTVDPVTRERVLDVSTLPDDLAIAAAWVEPGGGVAVRWTPEDRVTRHHPGWLRAAAERDWHPEAGLPVRESWDAAAMPEPVSFDGPPILNDDAALESWLGATWRHGLARLRHLPGEDDTVRRVAERIGVIRPTNFGVLFTVESKPDPDSAAYTAGGLTGHTDLPTRETQPGFQLLHCLENTCPDGHSTMVDGFRVAETIRDEAPEAFEALTTLRWTFSNRHRDFDYRWSGPLVETTPDGAIREIRSANALRAEPDMAEADVPRAYRAVRLFMGRLRAPRFVCRSAFAPGDLVIFDNRRVLHGRDPFDPRGGRRRLRGCYVDRDDVLSRLRVLARQRRAASHPARSSR